MTKSELQMAFELGTVRPARRKIAWEKFWYFVPSNVDGLIATASAGTLFFSQESSQDKYSRNRHWKVAVFSSSCTVKSNIDTCVWKLSTTSPDLPILHPRLNSTFFTFGSYEIFCMMDLRKTKLTAYYVPPPIPRKLGALQAEVRENGVRVISLRYIKLKAGRLAF